MPIKGHAGVKTVLFANNKGGVGKTALSSIFANALAAPNTRVLASDFDDQGNLSQALSETGVFAACDLLQWLHGKKELGGSGHVVLTASDGLISLTQKNLEKISARYAAAADNFDYHIIDVPPGASERMFLAIALADTIFVPLLPTHFSVHSANRFIGWLADMNASHKFAGFILNQVRHADKLAEEIRAALKGQIVTEIKFRRYIESTMARGGAIGWGRRAGANRDAETEIKAALSKIKRRL